MLNTDEVRESCYLEVKVEVEDSKREKTKGTKWGKINSNNRWENVLGGEVEDNSRGRDKDNEGTSGEVSPCDACRHTLPI